MKLISIVGAFLLISTGSAYTPFDFCGTNAKDGSLGAVRSLSLEVEGCYTLPCRIYDKGRVDYNMTFTTVRSSKYMVLEVNVDEGTGPEYVAVWKHDVCSKMTSAKCPVQSGQTVQISDTVDVGHHGKTNFKMDLLPRIYDEQGILLCLRIKTVLI